MREETSGRPGGANEGAAADPADAAPDRDTWRRGFGDPENWHDLAERGTPRNG